MEIDLSLSLNPHLHPASKTKQKKWNPLSEYVISFPREDENNCFIETGTNPMMYLEKPSLRAGTWFLNIFREVSHIPHSSTSGPVSNSTDLCLWSRQTSVWFSSCLRRTVHHPYWYNSERMFSISSVCGQPNVYRPRDNPSTYYKINIFTIF